MKIVQLSDVHFGAQLRDDVFNKVIDEVNELSPDAVIITGDLTLQPSHKQVILPFLIES